MCTLSDTCFLGPRRVHIPKAGRGRVDVPVVVCASGDATAVSEWVVVVSVALAG